MNENLESEYGSISPIAFSNAKMYDAYGNEIDNPKCEICGVYKTSVIVKNSHSWICTQCSL